MFQPPPPPRRHFLLSCRPPVLPTNLKLIIVQFLLDCHGSRRAGVHLRGVLRIQRFHIAGLQHRCPGKTLESRKPLAKIDDFVGWGPQNCSDGSQKQVHPQATDGNNTTANSNKTSCFFSSKVGKTERAHARVLSHALLTAKLTIQTTLLWLDPVRMLHLFVCTRCIPRYGRRGHIKVADQGTKPLTCC